MLRPHVGLAFVQGNLRMGAELAQVRFPNGGIRSTQAALTLAFTSNHLWAPEGGWGPTFQESVSWEGQHLGVGLLRVEPPVTVRTRNGRPQGPLNLAGVSLSTDLRGPFFRFVAADGATGGANSGYAQALTGLGLRLALWGPLDLQARLGAGLGGGGNLDTGGGFLLSGEGALSLGSGPWRATAGLGFLRAPGGGFHGRTYSFRLSHRTDVPVPGKGGDSLGAYHLADWRVSAGFQVYHRARQRGDREGSLQLVTLRADRGLGEHLYLSGEAGSATGGQAGGYSTGLAGLGIQTPAWVGQRFFIEAALGAGGGGSIRSGGGFLTSLRAGWRMEFPRGLGLDIAAGRIRAPHGELDSATYGIGLHLRFGALER